MTTDEHRLSRKTLNVIAASVIVSAVLLGLLYTVGTHRCLEKTLGVWPRNHGVFGERLRKI